MAGSGLMKDYSLSLTQLDLPFCWCHFQAGASWGSSSSSLILCSFPLSTSDSPWKSPGDDSIQTDLGHMPIAEPITGDLGEWNELIGQAWDRCLLLRSEVRSVPPGPHRLREREESFYRRKFRGRARNKGCGCDPVTPVTDSRSPE